MDSIKSGNVVVTLRKYKISDEILNTLNERQRKAINYLIEYGKITNKEYRELNPEISSNTALIDLKQLVQKGIFTAKGETKSRYYTFS
ncbi:MAG: hypothetical protein PQ975_00980 [Methanobacterium sp.]|jgi:ATP-dependent DNA helicase RecG